MYCIGRRDSQDFLLIPYYSSKFQCVSAVVSAAQNRTERAQSKINQLLKFVSEIQKGMMRGGGEGDGQM